MLNICVKLKGWIIVSYAWESLVLILLCLMIASFACIGIVVQVSPLAKYHSP